MYCIIDNNLSLYVSSRKPYGLATNFIESTDYHESKDKLINPRTKNIKKPITYQSCDNKMQTWFNFYLYMKEKKHKKKTIYQM